MSEDKIQLNVIIGEEEELMTLNTSNWYFTHRKDAHGAKELHFQQDTDPYGKLTRLLGTAHVHLEENKVSYYERVSSIIPNDSRYTTWKCSYIKLTQGFADTSQ